MMTLSSRACILHLTWRTLLAEHKQAEHYSAKSAYNVMRRRRIELRPIAWKAIMLTTTPAPLELG